MRCEGLTILVHVYVSNVSERDGAHMVLMYRATPWSITNVCSDKKHRISSCGVWLAGAAPLIRPPLVWIPLLLEASAPRLLASSHGHGLAAARFRTP